MLRSATGCLVLVARGFPGLSFLVFVSLYYVVCQPASKLFWWGESLVHPTQIFLIDFLRFITISGKNVAA
jgi:hypothetical protein